LFFKNDQEEEKVKDNKDEDEDVSFIVFEEEEDKDDDKEEEEKDDSDDSDDEEDNNNNNKDEDDNEDDNDEDDSADEEDENDDGTATRAIYSLFVRPSALPAREELPDPTCEDQDLFGAELDQGFCVVLLADPAVVARFSTEALPGFSRSDDVDVSTLRKRTILLCRTPGATSNGSPSCTLLSVSSPSRPTRRLAVPTTPASPSPRRRRPIVGLNFRKDCVIHAT
jgi:hypothetical protein